MDEALEGSLTSLEAFLGKPSFPSERERFRDAYYNATKLYQLLASQLRNQIAEEEKRLQSAQGKEKDKIYRRVRKLKEKLAEYESKINESKIVVKREGEEYLQDRSSERFQRIEKEVEAIGLRIDNFVDELLNSELRDALMKKWVEGVEERVMREFEEGRFGEGEKEVAAEIFNLIKEVIEVKLTGNLTQEKRDKFKRHFDSLEEQYPRILGIISVYVDVDTSTMEIRGFSHIDELLKLLIREYTSEYIKNLMLILKKHLPEKEYKDILEELRYNSFLSRYSFDFAREDLAKIVDLRILEQFRVLSSTEEVKELFGEEVIEKLRRRLGRNVLSSLFDKLASGARTADEVLKLLEIRDPKTTPYVIMAALSDPGYSGERPFIREDGGFRSRFLDYIKSLSDKEIEGLSEFGISSTKQIIELIYKPWNDNEKKSLLKKMAFSALREEKEGVQLLALRLLGDAIWENLNEKDIDVLVGIYKDSKNYRVKRKIANLAIFIANEEMSTQFMKAILSTLGMENLIDSLKSQLEEWEGIVIKEGFLEINFEKLVFLCQIGLGEGLDFRKFYRILNKSRFIFAYPEDEFREIVGDLGLNSTNLTYISEESFSYVAKLKDLFPLFRIVITQKPTQFNNFVESFKTIYPSGFTGDVEEAKSRVQEMLRSSSVILPSLLKVYLEEDVEKAMQLQWGIERALDLVFINTPINEMDLSEEVLREIIVYAFPGASLADVKRYLPQIREGVEKDVEEFTFPKDGYEIKMSLDKQLVYKLKEGESVDDRVIDKLGRLLEEDEESREAEVKKRGKQESILKEVGRVLKKAGAVDIDDALVLLREFLVHELVREGKYKRIKELAGSSSEDSLARFMREMREHLSKGFNENFVEWLKGMIRGGGIQIGGKKLNQIEREFILSKRGQIDQKDREVLKEAINYLKGEGANILSREEAIANIVSTIIKYRALKRRKGDGLLQMIKRELKKFETSSGTSLEKQSRLRLKFFVSKNPASFFAKFSAGICTRWDVQLFNRKDHFHINMVDPETNQCVGNIQVYKIDYHGRRALLFRGFNPSERLFLEYPSELIGEVLVEAVRRFAEDNGIEDVFVSEQLGGYHALSNSTDIFNFFSRRLLNPDFPGYEEVKLSEGYPITDIQRIFRMYRVPLGTRYTPIDREVI